MNSKVLFLDFDGVLFDTLKEVYLVNRFYCKKLDFFEPINTENYSLYSKYKFLVYNIWMFYYYNPILFDNPKEDEIVEKFNNALKNRDYLAETKFCEEFLRIRANLVKNHYEFWNNLETPYDFFFDIKKMYEENNIPIVVVSKKNKNAILERFASYGFNLPEDKVFAREILDIYPSKGEFMKEYMENEGYKTAIFVDDNDNNLKTTNNNPNIKNILALWGNAQPNLQGYSEKEATEEIKNYFISR